MKTTMIVSRTVLFSIAASIALCVAPAARAAVDTVTTTADSGSGSLRDTIAAANPGDIVNFSPGLTGQTIYLTGGELLVTNSITIDASGLFGGIIIAPVQSRGLEIAGSNVTINSLTVTNGYALGGGFPDGTGGAILVDSGCTLYATNCVFTSNHANLDGSAIECDNAVITLSHCTLSDNSGNGGGGGIDYVYGSATLCDCTISNNTATDGGGIYCYDGTLTLSNCIVSGNSATNAGGIDCGPATFTLNNCTIFGNSAADTGGGIDADGLAATNCIFFGNSANEGGGINCGGGTLDHCILSTNWAANGGGIAENNGELTLNDCTLTANAATNNGSGGAILNGSILTANGCTFSGNAALDGAAMVNSFAATLNNCTLSGNLATNGAGIYNYETLTMNNCTVSSNTVVMGDGGGIYSPYNGVTTVVLTNTIVAGNAANFEDDIFGNYSGAANFVGGNADLAPLGNYGGPTQTMPPLPGSPVIDAGVDSVTNFLATDQRGYPRLFGAHVDIGAVEARNFVVLNANDDGDGSLRAALTNCPDYVTFTNTLAGQTIYLTSGELLVTNTMTIDASALPGGIAIDAGQNSRVMQIGNATVTLNSLTVTNGYTSAGGGIENEGTATLIDCTLSGNTAAFGGGLYCYDRPLTLSNCLVSGNSASEGGGIDSGAATLTLNNCAFNDNSALNVGGGLEGGQLEGGTLEATNCTFTANSAGVYGGAVDGINGTLNQCTISNNVAQYGAAGINNEYGTLTLNNCTFVANVSTNGGGGAIGSGAFLTANNCTFTDNMSTNGGAINNAWWTTLNQCTFLGNSVTNGNGGGVYNYENLTVNNCTFLLNSAVNGDGGAIYNDIDVVSTLTLTNTTVTANTAGGVGGGIANGGILTANNSDFSGNTATNGGGIFNAVSMTLYNCTLDGNYASSGYGGGIYDDSTYAIYGEYATNFLINCTVYGNDANASGGGLYNDTSSILALTNTIVSSNSASAGNDISGVYSGVANFIGGNPKLIDTVPIFGSPVIDAGTDWVTNFLATDARGFPRLAGAHVDIGAVEAQTAPANNRPVLRYFLPDGSFMPANFQLMFTNVPNVDFTVITSTNLALPLAQWTVLGNAQQELNPGYYGFVDIGPMPLIISTNNSATVIPQQFYRVVSP